MTYREILHYAAQMLLEAGVEEADTDAWELLSYACGIDRTHYFLSAAEEVPVKQQEEYLALIRQRAERIPLQHLTGCQEFMGHSFTVSEAVLIPRQDTELLAELAIDRIRKSMAERACAEDAYHPDTEPADQSAEQKKPFSVLDLCCGSGCLAVSIQCFCPEVNVAAADVSDQALAIARKNAVNNRCGEIRFYCGDLFEPVNERFDLIVSNPPYIPSGEIGDLMPEVRDHEPRLALDGAGDGLAFYRRIIEEAPGYLENHGWLFFEIGWDQGPAVSELMRKRGFSDVSIRKDLAGLDRVVTGVWCCQAGAEMEK